MYDLVTKDVLTCPVNEMLKALEIGGVKSTVSAWNVKGDDGHTGAQIDLLIDRRDQVINICEVKFSMNEFQIDKDYDQKLRNKITVFRQETNCRKTIQLSMITSFGVQKNKYSSIVSNEVVLDDLFDSLS